jgi:hypothetical protein
LGHGGHGGPYHDKGDECPMPIRFRDSSAVVGRVRSTLADASAALAGTHAPPPNVTGSISSRLGDVICALVVQFTPVATRTGVIATTLQHFVAAEFGTSAPPPAPNRSGTIATTLAGATCSAVGTYAAPPSSSWWLNYPVMNLLTLQAGTALNLQDPAQHPLIADHDAFFFQGFNPTLARVANRCTNIDLILAQQVGQPIHTRFGTYTSFQQTVKDVNSDGDTRPNIDLINSPTEGNPNWWMRRVNGAQIEAPFDPQNYWMCNGARHTLKNSLNETYQQALWRKRKTLFNPSDDAHNLTRRLSFFFQDDVHARMQTPMSVNNGATVVTDPDMNNDGIAESITDFGTGANAGCRIWCEGHLDSQAAMQANFPGFVWFPNSSRLPTDYLSGVSPPKPLSLHPYYGKLELGLAETINLPFGIVFNAARTGYEYSGTGSLSNASRVLAIHAKMLKPDNQTVSGRAAVVAHINTLDRVLTAADYEFCRAILVMVMLQERIAVALCRWTTRAVSLNETLLEWGAPLATRSAGTLNETSVSFTMRAANFSSGSARFYWVEFAKAIAVLRGDNPSVGAWPSADAAVSCPLPSPGAGKKWQLINENYTNPLTGRSMRPQQPSLNTGADVTTVSLKPFHAIVVRRVDT